MRHLLFVTAVATVFGASSATAQIYRYVPPPPAPQYGQYSDVELVSQWYRQFVDRDPDQGGLDGWVTKMRTGTPPESVAAQMLGSEEFYGKAGSTPSGSVNALFQKAVGRWPTQEELEHWSRQVPLQGTTNVAQQVLQQTGFANRLAYPQRRYFGPWR